MTMSRVTDWPRAFDDPITLPNGRRLVTLQDAADYIMKLPKAEQTLPEWQTAIGCLIGAAERRDFLMHARIGVMRALNRHVDEGEGIIFRNSSAATDCARDRTGLWQDAGALDARQPVV